MNEWIDGYKYRYRLVAWYNTQEELKTIIEELVLKSYAECKYCGSVNCVRFGTYKGTQLWWCKDCNRKFADNKALPKMRTPVHQVAQTLSMYYGGMSLDSIARHLDQHYENPMTDAGIYKWLIRFSKHAVDTAKEFTPNVGDVWIADETTLKIGGEGSRKGKRGRQVWYWDIIDAKTRFLLAFHMSRTRNISDAITLFKQAEQRTGKAPRVIVTDGLAVYLDATEQVFGADTRHISSTPFTDKDSTNIIERYHGTLKDRTGIMRGFKDVVSARKLLQGWLVHYNFF